MPDNPISNPGVPPIEPTPPYGPNKPRLGAGEETEQRPFSFGPGPGKEAPEAPPERPSPMDVAGDAARKQPQLPPEDLSQNVLNLQNQLSGIQQKLQDSQVTRNFTADHYEAMQKVTKKMNPDMDNIAKNSNGAFSPPQQTAGQSVLNYITQWISSGQNTLDGALTYLQNKPVDGFNPASYLKLQYAVQRATQRGELFASIVGSSVSGIKTILSTQLG